MQFLLVKYCNFTVKHCGRARSVRTRGYPLVFTVLGEHLSGLRLHQGRFRLDIRTNFFTG